jgi:hypothetical protein
MDLRQAIAECQGERNPNAQTCIKLAAYYTILNQMDQPEKDTGYSGAAYKPETEYRSDTEFGQIASRMKTDDVLAVVDELMEALAVLNPKLYDGVIRNLEDRA